MTILKQKKRFRPDDATVPSKRLDPWHKFPARPQEGLGLILPGRGTYISLTTLSPESAEDDLARQLLQLAAFADRIQDSKDADFVVEVREPEGLIRRYFKNNHQEK